jgi:hypothetical protein
LRAWLTAEGTVLPGYWSSRVTHADAARAARQRVADRHGRAGVRLLRAGEQVLTADRIAEHGRHALSLAVKRSAVVAMCRSAFLAR